MKQRLDVEAFSKAIRQKRIIDLNIGVREAAKIIGTSPATLSRCENGKLPDLITYANICFWLDERMESFITIAKKKVFHKSKI